LQWTKVEAFSGRSMSPPIGDVRVSAGDRP
jgi:hypothetical protein